MNTMTTDRTIEILSPAGSADAFRAAVRAGADAVYVGGSRFGARAYADNFNEEELVDAIHEAHFYGRKLYLTVNTLLKETEIHSLYEYLAPYYESGLDAVDVLTEVNRHRFERLFHRFEEIAAGTGRVATGCRRKIPKHKTEKRTRKSSTHGSFFSPVEKECRQIQ